MTANQDQCIDQKCNTNQQVFQVHAPVDAKSTSGVGCNCGRTVNLKRVNTAAAVCSHLNHLPLLMAIPTSLSAQVS